MIQWRWNSTGTTVAGINSSLGTTTTQLNSPSGLIMDTSNTLYISDRYNHRVQKWLIGASNSTTVAGLYNGTASSTLNGLNSPNDVAVDSSGNLYVADTMNHRVLLWTTGASSGILYAGNGKTSCRTANFVSFLLSTISTKLKFKVN